MTSIEGGAVRILDEDSTVVSGDNDDGDDAGPDVIVAVGAESCEHHMTDRDRKTDSRWSVCGCRTWYGTSVSKCMAIYTQKDVQGRMSV